LWIGKQGITSKGTAKDKSKFINLRDIEKNIEKYINKHPYGYWEWSIMNAFTCIINIDNFKKINDTKGHKKGDMILKKTATIIKNTITINTIITRRTINIFATNKHTYIFSRNSKICLECRN
jgi:diguanylate cyclase (GGDEF)-like protein